MRKILQYIRIILIVGPVILFYHFHYMIKFAKHPEKYPLEKRYAVARKEISFVINKFHIDYKISNFEKFTKSNEKYLLISNHLSFFDPLIIIANSEKPVTFVAKKEVFNFPFVGKVAKALEVFPLNRENLMSQISEIKKIVNYLKDENKPSVIIYIEGTRNNFPERECLAFHPGTLKIAQMAKVPLHILGTFGTFRILDKHLYLPSYPAYLSLIDTLSSEEVSKANTTDLAAQLKEKIDHQVDLFRKEDISYINSLKISDKKKKLETIVDARAKA